MAAMASKRKTAAVVTRLVFAAVFVVNVQCALGFLLVPGDFTAGFMLEDAGRVGQIAVAGLGVAFLMWNATYPPFIVAPDRFCVLGVVILTQQLIGLVGEVYLYMTIAADPAFAILSASLLRFIVFDGVGLLLMAAALLWLYRASRKGPTL